MKVRELEKGMILTCINKDDCFAIYGDIGRWAIVRAKPPYGARSVWGNVEICPDTVAIYLGTKKDIDIDMKWTDRFVLLNNQIVGVDPASWRRIKPL